MNLCGTFPDSPLTSTSFLPSQPLSRRPPFTVLSAGTWGSCLWGWVSIRVPPGLSGKWDPPVPSGNRYIVWSRQTGWVTRCRGRGNNCRWRWSHERNRIGEDWRWDTIGAEIYVVSHASFKCNMMDNCRYVKSHGSLHDTSMTTHDVSGRNYCIITFNRGWVFFIQGGQMTPLAWPKMQMVAAPCQHYQVLIRAITTFCTSGAFNLSQIDVNWSCSACWTFHRLSEGTPQAVLMKSVSTCVSSNGIGVTEGCYTRVAHN